MELGSPVGFTSYTDSNILNYGVGIFGDTTLTLWDKLDLTAGLRYDYEDAHGNVDNFSNPAVTGSTSQTGSKDFDDLSPRFAVGYHWSKDLMTYAEASHGYKVGGFNSTAPTNAFAFGPEKSWDYELGVKSTWLDDRLQLNADLFYIDWRDMQLDVPTGEPSVFYTANVGSSDSRGAELEGSYRITRDWQLFGGIGYTDALFRHYTQTNGVSADGNRLPFAPEITWNAGTQYNLNLQHGFKAWARAEVIGIGHYFYDASNAARQDTYIITNFRVGVGKDHWRLEGFINNAFNSHYFPIAYPFQLAASGYVGESGAPQTMGIDLGFSY
jgi:iron complex outermembrane receptor protein